VDTGPLAAEGRDLIAPFAKLVRTRRPWVILKWAQSLDGKIATHSGESKWISDATCRAHAHRVRGRLDAILVGVQTVLRDDPLLTCRVGRAKRVATRIVLDTNLQIRTASRLVRTAEEIPTWVFCGRSAPGRRAKALERAGCVVRRVTRDRHGLSLAAILDTLGRQSMTNVLVEGGGKLLGRFFDQGLGDEVHVYVTPMLIGGAGAPNALEGVGVPRVAKAVRFRPGARLRRLGGGYLLQERVPALA
jgi:diaminohydroxyphosphoribosylaminopyrimidine deaminase/5-amino-6-(5-phosphoribosylamino)uracil reductase